MADTATTKVYLIRHAQAMGNYLRRFQGITDAEITETGEKQLEALSERCKAYSFDAAYSSPLIRAKKTALAAIGGRDIQLNIDPRLLELNIGILEDVPFADLPVKYAELYKIWTDEPHLFHAPDGESMSDMRDRIVGGFLDIVSKNRGKTILVVSHGCAMRSLLCTLKGMDFRDLSTVEWCDNTAVYEIEFDDKLNAEFITERDVSHLSDDIATFSSQTWWRKIKHSGSRALGVDYGDVRTGIALSDLGRTLASPVGTVTETGFDALVAAVIKLAKDNGCSDIVIGLPLNMNGTKGERALNAERFAHAVEKKCGISTYLWDERLTTVGAAQYMNATDTKGKKRKSTIDAASACLILQGWLDRQARD